MWTPLSLTPVSLNETTESSRKSFTVAKDCKQSKYPTIKDHFLKMIVQLVDRVKYHKQP